MKPTDAKTSTYIEFEVKSNGKEPKFVFNDYVRISKYKNIFANDYTQFGRKKLLCLKNVKSTVPWTYVVEINRTCYEKRFAKDKSNKISS